MTNDLQQTAQDKTHDDARDEWLVCPECGSDQAVVVSIRYGLTAACPACGATLRLYGE